MFTKRILPVLVLLFSCNEPPDSKNIYCIDIENHYSYSTRFQDIQYDSEEDILYFLYLGDHHGVTIPGLYSYNFNTQIFDSVLTARRTKSVISKLSFFMNNRSFLFTINNKIWAFDLDSDSLYQISYGMSVYGAQYRPNSEWITYIKMVEPESGIWKHNYITGDNEHIFNYCNTLVWDESGDYFYTGRHDNDTGDLIIFKVDDEGIEIEEPTIIEGDFRRLKILDLLTNNKVLVSVLKVGGDEYLIGIVDLIKTEIYILSTGDHSYWDGDNKQIFYNYPIDNKDGVWVMDSIGCNRNRIITTTSLQYYIYDLYIK